MVEEIHCPVREQRGLFSHWPIIIMINLKTCPSNDKGNDKVSKCSKQIDCSSVNKISA